MTKSINVPSPAKIKVVGMGGSGCNAVTRMVQEGIQGVEFIAMNTDAQHLELTEASVKIQLGTKTVRGLGAGGDHSRGRKAAEECIDEIQNVINGSDMVFVTAGMGGGTGTGSAPVIAQIAKKTGALTIAVVTTPFKFEGLHRAKVADEGIRNLVPHVDTLIIVPNEKVLDLCDKRTSIANAFRMADEVLHQGVQSIAEVITVPGFINLDFADVRAIMQDAGHAWMSIGWGDGPNRAVDAAKQALTSPLLDTSVYGAKKVMFNVVGGGDLTLFEVNDAAETIKKAVAPDAKVIFGVMVDPALESKVRLTLIATGFATKEESEEQEKQLDAAKQEDVRRLLKSENPEELDIPSIFRNLRKKK
ncbi:MAG: cell division protein FtsZ [Dehalococcoidales bacterium]